MRLNTSNYLPEEVFVQRASLEDPLTERILARLAESGQPVPVRILDERGDPSSELDLFDEKGLTEAERFSRGKRRLLLTRHLGDWLRACPGTSHHVCCNLWTVNPGEGCPLDCSYCYLQSYLRRNPTLKLYTNTSAMLEEIRQRTQADPERYYRIGTGEVIDSLVWDRLSDASLELVPFFASLPNAVLELKTKTDFVENLLALAQEHKGKTVVSWSVNARQVTDVEERRTSSLEQRIAAAQHVAAAGYRIGLHFDPLVHFTGWQDGYRDAVHYILGNLPLESIAWISVSSLRYAPEMHSIMVERFPESKLPYGEQFLAKDRKLRYIQPLRLKMVSFVWNELRSFSSKLPVYMCMESSTAWRQIAGGPPVAGEELREVFAKRPGLPIVA